MKTYDIAFTAHVGNYDGANLLDEGMMDYYNRVGVTLEEMGIATTISIQDGDLNFDMSTEAENRENAQAICLSAFATACLFMGARMYRRKERPFDAYSQN